MTLEKNIGTKLSHQVLGALGVGLIRYFVSAEELAAGSHAAALSCGSFPRDSVAGFKNKCRENTHQAPLTSLFKSFPQ